MPDPAEGLALPEDPLLAQQGWRLLHPPAGRGYDSRLPPLLIRRGKPGEAEARIETGAAGANSAGGLHGGFLASIAEVTLFLPLFLHGRVSSIGAATIDLSVQYLTAGTVDAPVEAHIQLLQETGRLGFVRGMLSQREKPICAYSGTVRKFAIAPA